MKLYLLPTVHKHEQYFKIVEIMLAVLKFYPSVDDAEEIEQVHACTGWDTWIRGMYIQSLDNVGV